MKSRRANRISRKSRFRPSVTSKSIRLSAAAMSSASFPEFWRFETCSYSELPITSATRLSCAYACTLGAITIQTTQNPSQKEWRRYIVFLASQMVLRRFFITYVSHFRSLAILCNQSLLAKAFGVRKGQLRAHSGPRCHCSTVPCSAVSLLRRTAQSRHSTENRDSAIASPQSCRSMRTQSLRNYKCRRRRHWLQIEQYIGFFPTRVSWLSGGIRPIHVWVVELRPFVW